MLQIEFNIILRLSNLKKRITEQKCALIAYLRPFLSPIMPGESHPVHLSSISFLDSKIISMNLTVG